MLEIFRRNRFFNSLLLLPYTVLVRIWLVFTDAQIDFKAQGVLSEWMFGWLNASGGLGIVLNIFLVYFQGLMLNRLIIRNRLTNDMTLFPGLFYILVVSFSPDYNQLSAPLIANTFLIVGLDHLYATGKNMATASRIFSAGFWLSTGFLFYFGYIVLLLYGVLALSIFRTVKPNQWLQYLAGWIAPIWLVGGLTYLARGDIIPLGNHLAQFGFLDFQRPFTGHSYAHIVLFATLIMVAVFNYGSFTLKSNILVRKKINLLYWLLFLLPTVAFVQANITFTDWVILVVPLACFIAMIFVRSRQLLLLEIFHFGILLALLGLHIAYLL